ncbi:MAG: hypothetical protein ACI82H_002128 [Alphaproteobacteria bacterium]|jgi:uncharacterized protein (DUF983 family)
MSVEPAAKRPPAPWFPALLKGLMGSCPACGQGRLFSSYAKLRPTCDHCAVALAPHRADDAPAYFTIFITGHIVVPLILVVERIYAPATWVHMAIWMPLTLGLTLVILPRVKGALIGLQWALNLRQDD